MLCCWEESKCNRLYNINWAGSDGPNKRGRQQTGPLLNGLAEMYLSWGCTIWAGTCEAGKIGLASSAIKVFGNKDLAKIVNDTDATAELSSI